MENESGRKSGCVLHEHIYHDDAHVCERNRCMICNDGEWEETQDLFPPKRSGNLSP